MLCGSDRGGSWQFTVANPHTGVSALSPCLTVALQAGAQVSFVLAVACQLQVTARGFDTVWGHRHGLGVKRVSVLRSNQVK